MLKFLLNKRSRTFGSKLLSITAAIVLVSTNVNAGSFENKNSNNNDRVCVIQRTVFNLHQLDRIVSDVFELETPLLDESDLAVIVSKEGKLVSEIRLGISPDVSVSTFNSIYLLDKIISFAEVRNFIANSDPINNFTTVRDFIAYLFLEDYFSYDLFSIGVITETALDEQTLRFIDTLNSVSDELNVELDKEFDTDINRYNAKRLLTPFLDSKLISRIPKDVKADHAI